MSVWSHVLFVALHPKDARVGIKEVASQSMGNTEYGIKVEEIESKRDYDTRQFRVSISSARTVMPPRRRSTSLSKIWSNPAHAVSTVPLTSAT